MGRTVMAMWIGTVALLLGSTGCAFDASGDGEAVEGEGSALIPFEHEALVPAPVVPAAVSSSPAAWSLVSPMGQDARSAVCVTSTAERRVLAIDEYHCKPVDGGDLCAGCVMHFVPKHTSGWQLEAREASEDCQLFAGSYEVAAPGQNTCALRRGSLDEE
jgi:hypothetical protein